MTIHVAPSAVIPNKRYAVDSVPSTVPAVAEALHNPRSELLRSGQLNGVPYTLERRLVRQRTIDKTVFIIADDIGDLYAFLDHMAANLHWRDMGIRALAEPGAA